LKSAIYRPSALAVDPAGRLLAGDSANRLLVYTPPFRTGMDAARIAGLYVNVQGQPAKPQVNEYTLFGPEGIFATSAGIFVVEGISNRIVRHDPFDQWPAETDLVPSPAAKAVFGQPDMFSARANRGGLEANETGFAAPAGVAVAGSEVYVADSGNNRVLALPLNGGNVGGATRVLGQISLNYRSINMTDGAGLYLAAGGTSIPGTGNVVVGGAVIIDRSSNPPHLYIADTFNNRVLGFADARSAKQGDQADVVIGQTSQYEARVNSPTSNPDQLTDQGLFAPIGVAVDASGNLYVADSGNGRVLRFPKPFEQAQKFGQRADLVLGQSGFNIKIVDATQRNMSRPYGLAFTVDGHLMASDVAHNRVLLFRKSASGDFSNGQPAGSVFGQRDFTTSSAGAEETRFNAPMHIASDTDDRLYVCDPGNRRVAIFDRVLFATTHPSPAIT
jgi:sugar lactone lactonase YvrE